MNRKVEKIVVLIIALGSYLLTALSNSIVITGLTKIASDLNLNQILPSWVQNAYGLAFGSFLLLAGRLSDSFSHKSILNIALIIFMLGSFLVGFTTGGGLMIFARFLQGIGSALLAPTSMALLVDNFEGPALVKAIAWYSSTAGLGASLGLILGGIFASYWTWRIGFYLNVPIALVMLVLSLIYLRSKKMPRTKFDILGTIFSIIGLGSLVYALNGAKNVWLTLLVSVILIVIFIFWESKSKHPIMPLSIFKSRVRVIGYSARAVLNGAIMGFWFFASEYIQRVFHYTPVQTGFAYLPMSLILFISAALVSRLIIRYGNKKVYTAAAIITLVGFIWTICFLDRGYWLTLGFPMILFGAGEGLALAPLTNMGLYQVNENDTGVASGLVNVAHQIGGVLGLAIMVNISTTLLPNGGTDGQFIIAMYVGLVLAIIVVLLSFFSTDEDKND